MQAIRIGEPQRVRLVSGLNLRQVSRMREGHSLLTETVGGAVERAVEVEDEVEDEERDQLHKSIQETTETWLESKMLEHGAIREIDSGLLQIHERCIPQI